jgi:DeoR/GlpR family transcriptional regulator of sugar metabolism
MAGDATPGPSALRARTTSVVVPEREGEAGTNRALLERARQVIVVADASKLECAAFARICALGEVTS